MRWSLFTLAAGLAVLAVPGVAQAQAKQVSFSKDIVPILKESCGKCHNAKQPTGGLSLATFADLQKGSKSGKLLSTKVADNRLIGYLEGKLKPQMPPGKPLPKDQIDLFKAWISQGAKADIDPNHAIITNTTIPTVKVPVVPLRVPVLPQAASLAWSKDGKILAVGSYKVVKLLDPATGKVIRELSGHTDVVHDLKFSPDGKHLAAAGGPPAQEGEVKIWDVTSGSLVRTINGHSDYIYSCSWSPDGKNLATASYDKLVKIWDVSTGKEIRELKDHADAVYAVAFNPTGNLIATGSADRSVKVWDVATGRRLYTLSGHGDIVFTVSWNAKGNQISSGGADKTLRTWNVNAQNGNQARNTAAHGNSVNEVVYSGDGNLLATAGADRSVKIWNAANGQTAQTIGDLSSPVLSLSFSPDGKQLAVGGFDGSVRVFNTADGKPAITLIETPKAPSQAKAQ